jgi:hypothetical protein
VERIRAGYDKYVRDLESAQSDIRQTAKQLERKTGELNETLEKRLLRTEKRNVKKAGQVTDWLKLFMPAADPKASKRQPVNRVQPQAQSMPANRFMAPAASAAKGELSERFR